MVLKKPKKKSKSQLMKKADAVFSSFIRNKYAFDGVVQCVTCGVKAPVKSMQAGHYYRRNYHALRYDERNVHPQCAPCNIWRSGNKPQHALYLVRTYGPNILDELEIESHRLVKGSVAYYTEIIEKYKE